MCPLHGDREHTNNVDPPRTNYSHSVLHDGHVGGCVQSTALCRAITLCILEGIDFAMCAVWRHRGVYAVKRVSSWLMETDSLNTRPVCLLYTLPVGKLPSNFCPYFC